MNIRVGHGFDVHTFGGNGPIVIGGVNIPYNKGLLAFSDGDVAIHAIIDALLGASALGDIGKLFPNNNIIFKNANSRDLLRKSWQYIQNKNYKIGNVDITIIAQEPKMSSYTSKMRYLLSQDLNCNINDINVKTTTTEKLGFIGRKEGIACEAVAILLKYEK